MGFNYQKYRHGTSLVKCCLLLDDCLVFYKGLEEVTAPTIAEMGDEAAAITWRVMGKGSDKSAYGDWLLKDRPTHDYHIARAIRHLATAQMQLHKSTPCPDNNGETATDHLERALVRCLFTLAQIKKEVSRL